MGDHADDAIDAGLYEYLAGDEFYPDDPIDGAYIKRGKVCKICGRPDLHWQELSVGWRLHETSGKIHTCNFLEKY